MVAARSRLKLRVPVLKNFGTQIDATLNVTARINSTR
jgi:hypothetical protein